MYLKDFKEIEKIIEAMKILIDEISPDIKSQSFFQPNRSLQELLSWRLSYLSDILNGNKSYDD